MVMSLAVKAALAASLVLFAAGTGSGAATAHDSRSGVISGHASWYGHQFHGRRTANGERFDMDALTAAHRSLPFGSTVRVTNSQTDAAVVVRINDRGPYAGDRVIDLSRAAAKKVQMIGAGVAPVELEVLRRGDG